MTGLQTIYVDFAARDPNGLVYVARLSAFATEPELGECFIGSDYDQFEQVLCEVIGYDKVRGRVLHRPVNPADVPGTAQRSDPPVVAVPAYLEQAPKTPNEKILVRG